MPRGDLRSRALLRQRFVNPRPALDALGMQPFDGRADAPSRRLGKTPEFLRRQHHRHVAPLSLHPHRLRLRHVDELAETVLGSGGGDGFHSRRLAELANLDKTTSDKTLMCEPPIVAAIAAAKGDGYHASRATSSRRPCPSPSCIDAEDRGQNERSERGEHLADLLDGSIRVRPSGL